VIDMAAPEKSRRSRLVFALAAVGVFGLALLLLYTAPRPAADQAAMAAASAVGERPSVVVDGTRVRLVPSRHEVVISATFAARREVVIGAEVSGRVIELSAEENQRIELGAPIVRLDPALAEAAVERARAALSSARAIADLGRALHQRQKELAQQGVGSRTEFDRTLSEATRSASAVAESKAALGEAETLLAKTVIRAPFSGVVSRFELEPGAYVRAGDAVADMADLSEIEIDVGVDDRQIIALDEASPVRVAADALPGEWFDGRIASLGRVPDAASRKYRVPVRVPNPDMRLLPGMLGRVVLTLGDETPTIRVARRAVQSEYELDFVWVLVGEAHSTGTDTAGGAGDEAIAEVERRRVRAVPVPFRPDLVDVTAGLEPGDVVATSNLRELSEGLRVRVTAVEGSEVALP